MTEEPLHGKGEHVGISLLAIALHQTNVEFVVLVDGLVRDRLWVTTVSVSLAQLVQSTVRTCATAEL